MTQRWLYRQAVGMSEVDVHVIAKKWIEPSQSPADGIGVEILPVNTQLSKYRLLRYGEILRNWKADFFLGTSKELQWWKQRTNLDKPDVVLCHFGPTAARLMPVLKKMNVPVVTHFNGNDLSGQLRSRGYRTRLLKCLPQLKGCVVVAQYMHDWLVAQGYPESQIRMIPYGTPLEELTPAPNVGQQPCRFLGVGRFTEKKRPDLTIKAFAKCVEHSPDVELVLGGDGALLAKCRHLVEELKIAAKVRFLGSLTSNQVKEQMSKSSVFVQHSVTGADGDREGWPVAIAEAAGSGLPVVATRHAGITTQVDEGQTGFLVAEGDWQSMATNMSTLAADPSLRVKMGKAAREKMALFDTTVQIGKLEEFLIQCAGQNIVG